MAVRSSYHRSVAEPFPLTAFGHMAQRGQVAYAVLCFRCR